MKTPNRGRRNINYDKFKPQVAATPQSSESSKPKSKTGWNWNAIGAILTALGLIFGVYQFSRNEDDNNENKQSEDRKFKILNEPVLNMAVRVGKEKLDGNLQYFRANCSLVNQGNLPVLLDSVHGFVLNKEINDGVGSPIPANIKLGAHGTITIKLDIPPPFDVMKQFVALRVFYSMPYSDEHYTHLFTFLWKGVDDDGSFEPNLVTASYEHERIERYLSSPAAKHLIVYGVDLLTLKDYYQSLKERVH